MRKSRPQTGWKVAVTHSFNVASVWHRAINKVSEVLYSKKGAHFASFLDYFLMLDHLWYTFLADLAKSQV